MRYTAHVDTFARDRLPPREQWPEFRFDLPELHYPPRLNCASVLLDEAILEGHGARIALYSSSGNWTYFELLERANRIANVLVRDLGVVPGNRVLLRGANSPMLVASWLAVMKVGAIAVTTMPMLRAKELAVIAERAHIDHAICEARLVAELHEAARATGRLSRVATYGDGALERLMAQRTDEFKNVTTAADDVCLLAFTSGTTGNPKATMHFHRDVLVMRDVVGRHLLETSPDDIYTGSPPLGFTFGLGALLVFPLGGRGAVALVEQPTPDNLLDAIAPLSCDRAVYRADCLSRARAAGRRPRHFEPAPLHLGRRSAAEGDLGCLACGHRPAHHRRHRRDRDDPHLHLREGRGHPSRRDRQAAARLPGLRARRAGPAAVAAERRTPGGEGSERLPLSRRPAPARIRAERLERHRRSLLHRRGRLLLVPGARRRHDHLGRLQHRRTGSGGSVACSIRLCGSAQWSARATSSADRSSRLSS